MSLVPVKFPIIMGGGRSLASITCTTTGAQTLTIAALTVSSGNTVVVDWGDGSSSSYTGAGARTHDYAGAGTYVVKFYNPLAITTFTVSDNKITLTSSGIKSMINVTTFQANGLKGGSFNSADISAWRPTSFQLYSMPAGFTGMFDSADISAWRPSVFSFATMPAGYAGTFNSSDISAWRPATFIFAAMPAGYAGTFNSSDISAWRPASFNFYTMPVGYTITFTAGSLSGWTTSTQVYIILALSQAMVDNILSDMWQAFATRTASAGSLNLGGTNSAPSGILQAANPPTTGKEFAYELANDSQNINPTHKWATVTITA